MAMLVTLCWGLQSVVNSGECNHPTTRWEVVKNSASPKRPFFFFLSHFFRAFPHFQLPVHILGTYDGTFLSMVCENPKNVVGPHSIASFLVGQLVKSETDRVHC